MRLAGGRVRPAFFYLLPLALLCLAAVALAAAQGDMRHGQRLRLRAFLPLVRQLALTDLCAATEARYTRHPAVTELSVAFQDHPGSLEHFPGGSFWAPPAAGQ